MRAVTGGCSIQWDEFESISIVAAAVNSAIISISSGEIPQKKESEEKVK